MPTLEERVSKLERDIASRLRSMIDNLYVKGRMVVSGKFLLSGDGLVWKDANIGSLVLQTGGTLPGIVEIQDSLGAGTGIYTRGFAVNEQGSSSIEIPHDYKEGTDLTFHIHWLSNDAPTGTDYLKWQLTYSVSRGATAFPASTTIYKEVSVPSQHVERRSDLTAISGTNFKIGDHFNFALKRITADGDAFSGEALVLTMGFHYQCDMVGSSEITSK